ncbi:PAC2 family protein [Bifidobacterium aquikefiri]|uniref:PAC2 family protein n=1 Tax=Bifidobacterium aquikefiri TaxID=1653207 RepID=UPI001FCE40BE|nr:PAC2 family protein [Bifidobacterium aquikefiri]
MSEETFQTRRVLVSAFEGWNDACQAASNVVRHLIDMYDSNEVARISCDGFYDYQTTRPMMCFVQGRGRIVWPETTFYEIHIDDRHTIVAEVGPEPNYRWMEYCHQNLHIAEEYDVDHVITLGSMFADCPHTRALPIDVYSDDCECNCSGTDDHCGPVGITTVLDSIARDHGFDTDSVWVSVPQYLGSDECAQGTLQLLRKLSQLLGVTLNEGDLPTKGKQWKAQASMLLSCNDDLADYVKRLERQVDTKTLADESDEMTTDEARELIAEAEAYLQREQNKDNHKGHPGPDYPDSAAGNALSE